MNRSCALLSAMPCDRTAAEQMFSSICSGSFAEEWARSQPESITSMEFINSYLDVIPRVWTHINQMLNALNITMIPNATSGDLVKAFETYDVVGLLAHHVEDSFGKSCGIEFSDRIISSKDLEIIAPKEEAIIHLGVCRSIPFIEPLKAKCGQVRVIVSQAQVEPEFYLRAFAYTVQLWRNVGGDYVQRHLEVRNAMLDELGAKI